MRYFIPAIKQKYKKPVALAGYLQVADNLKKAGM